MIGERIDSVWDLLVARIAALEARVEVLERELAELREADKADTETVYDYMAEHDGWNEPIWIGGNDGPDD